MYLTALVRVPHVADTSSIKGFLGLMEKVCKCCTFAATLTVCVRVWLRLFLSGARDFSCDHVSRLGTNSHTIVRAWHSSSGGIRTGTFGMRHCCGRVKIG